MDEKEVINKAFETSPDTVYGVLVGILVVGILSLYYKNSRLQSKNWKLQNKLISLNVSTIGVLKDLNTSLLLLKEESDNSTDKLINQITQIREHISNKIDSFKIEIHGKG